MAAPSSPLLTLYDRCVPPLRDATYTLRVSQTLEGVPDMGVLPADAERQFEVRGPRYSLPTADIHRLYPPPHGVGPYHQDLPMVVFNRRAVPWEIRLTGEGTDEMPWMALLVLTADQITQPTPPTQSGTTRMSLQALLTPAPGVLTPQIAPMKGEQAEDIQVEALEIPAKVALELLPSLADATALAHVRVVSGGTSLEAAHDGHFSVVIANRFAAPPPTGAGQPARANFACLVSLEGFEGLLSGGPNAATLQGVSTVRLIALKTWTFTCVQDAAQSFSARTKQLSAGLAPGDLLLRPPPANKTAPATVQTRLARGYVALPHALRDGRQTFAWYRGPCAPELSRPITPGESWPPRCAGDGMVLDPALGVFDQSYAVAWQTGRLLALSSQAFSTNLLQWRRSAHALVDLLLARLPDGAQGASGKSVDELVALLEPKLLSAQLTAFVASETFGALSAKIGAAGGYPADGVAVAPVPITTPAERASGLSDLLQSPEVQELLLHLSGFSEGADKAMHASILPDQLLRWLAKRALLVGVPLDQLVPDGRLLPPESIRFFALDPNWLDALLEGALSVGIQSSRDSVFHQITRDPLKRAVDLVIGELRAEAIGDTVANPVSTGAMGGFLLRSQVIEEHKGLEVRGWFDDGGTPRIMHPLRYDRVAPGMLLCVFPRVPVLVDLEEPKQGLVFGVEDDGLRLRSLDPNTLGTPTTPLPTDQIPLRPGCLTLDVTALVAKLAQALHVPTLGPADLSLQLLRSPEVKRFPFTGLQAPLPEVSP